jgi:hypothetical protein
MPSHRTLTGNVGLFAVSGLALVATSASAPVEITHSPKAQRELAKALAGRTAGRPVQCMYNFPAAKMQVIDDWTILFRNRDTIYVQNPPGGCRNIGFPGYTLVTRQIGINQLCNGDIAYLRQVSTGNGGGSCIFGPFTPYTKPK